MVICLAQGADLHTAQLMPLPLTVVTVSCFSKIQSGFTFLVLAHPCSPGKGPLNVCVCVCVCSFFSLKGVVSRRHPEEINPLIDGRVGLPLNAVV